MSKIFELKLVTFGLVLFVSCSSNNYGEIKFDKISHDFDTLTNYIDAEVYFVYENVGNRNLRITEISTSCGCTVPQYKTSPLKPSEKDSFLVAYDILNKGFFLKELVVYTNSPLSPQKIYVKGYVPFE